MVHNYKDEQDTHCTCNLTLRRVHATIVVVGKQWVLHIVCVCVALGIQGAMRLRNIIVCGLPRSIIVSTLSQKGTIFGKKGTEHKVRVFISFTNFFWNIPHVKCLLFLSDFNETWIFWTVFRKHVNIRFQENPSRASRVVPCGKTDGRTDVTKIIGVFAILRTRLKTIEMNFCRLGGEVSSVRRVTQVEREKFPSPLKHV